MSKQKPQVKSFSFKNKYKEEYKHVVNMKNASDYICQLIRKDIKERSTLSDIELARRITDTADELFLLKEIQTKRYNDTP